MHCESIVGSHDVDSVHCVQDASRDFQVLGSTPHTFFLVGHQCETENYPNYSLRKNAQVEEYCIEVCGFEFATFFDLRQGKKIDQDERCEAGKLDQLKSVLLHEDLPR